MQLALLPADLMDQLGIEAFEEMKRSAPISSSESQTALVQCVAGSTIAAARRLYQNAAGNWEVVLFDNPSPNAFALPGGKIGVHTGLLDVAENSDQLAAVIGHEIAHVIAEHGNERMTQQLGINLVLIVVGLVTESDSDLLRQALGLGAHFGVTLPFSRAHETEADIIGLDIMAAAGFRPEEAMALWRNMSAYGGGQPPEFASTHPGHDTRIDDLSAAMSRATRLYEQAQVPDC